MKSKNEQLEQLRELIAGADARLLHVLRTVDIPHFVGISNHERADLFKACDRRWREITGK